MPRPGATGASNRRHECPLVSRITPRVAATVTDALAYKRSQGILLGTLPAGYQRDQDAAILVVEAVAPVIRTVFERYGSGDYAFRTLAQFPNGPGIRRSLRMPGS